MIFQWILSGRRVKTRLARHSTVTSSPHDRADSAHIIVVITVVITGTQADVIGSLSECLGADGCIIDSGSTDPDAGCVKDIGTQVGLFGQISDIDGQCLFFLNSHFVPLSEFISAGEYSCGFFADAQAGSP